MRMRRSRERIVRDVSGHRRLPVDLSQGEGQPEASYPVKRPVGCRRRFNVVIHQAIVCTRPQISLPER
jgi:hypothetical protein